MSMISVCQSPEIDVNSLIDAQTTGFSLAQPFYADQRILDLEMNRIFSRYWLYAGHVSQIPQTGDYFLVNVAQESIIVVRGDDQQVHALYNVCRHRGSNICLESQGKVKKLVCPYHAWVYDTDGTLLAARHMPDSFDKASYGLHRCGVQVVQGLIFICLEPEKANDFSPIASQIEQLFAPHGFAAGKVIDALTLRTACNWKIAAENSWECYHCGHSHPEFSSVMSYTTAQDSKRQEDLNKLQQQWEQYAKSIGHHTFENADEIARTQGMYINRTVIRPGYCTQSLDGKPVAPLMGSMREYDGGISGFMTFPVIWFAASSDHGLLTRFMPITATECEVQYAWIVRGDAVEGKDYDLNRVTELWRITGIQDKKICEDNQKGVSSRKYQPGPYSAPEQTTSDFVNWYLQAMKL